MPITASILPNFWLNLYTNPTKKRAATVMGKNYSKAQRDAANYKLFQQMDLADTIPANERNDWGL